MSNKAYEFARSKIGLREIKGEEHNPEILEMFASVGHSWIKDDETPWCAAFVGWCLKSAGLPYLKEVAARKYENYGKTVITPKVGDIAVFWRVSKSSGLGHVGFIVDETPTHLKILGGNQNNEVSIKPYPKKQFLCYCRVEDAPDNNEADKRIKELETENYNLKKEVVQLRDDLASVTMDFIAIQGLAKEILKLSE